MSSLTLVIGNKSYSSWSLRPWLALRHTGATFDEIVIPLRTAETKSTILSHSSAGKVPVLRHGDVTVWESLAICEYVADLFPEAGLWPEDRRLRALARSVATEMHGGFPEIRKAFPMDLKRTPAVVPVPASAIPELERLFDMWKGLRSVVGNDDGPFLFGRFTIADAMYAPICTRLHTYGIPLDSDSHKYVESILALPAMVEWRAAAAVEPWTITY